jgi:hypothetical protein
MSQSLIDKWFDRLWHFTFSRIGPKIKANALKSFMDRFFVLFEHIGQKFEILSKNYFHVYERIVDDEIRMANVQETDIILVIGCGSLPITPVLLAQKTKAKVVTIDNNANAIANATRFLTHNKLGNILSLQHADGLHYPLEKFSVIFLLYGIKKRRDLLTYLAESMNNTTRLIFRTMIDEKYCIRGTDIILTDLFTVKYVLHEEYLGSLDSLLLTKKK